MFIYIKKDIYIMWVILSCLHATFVIWNFAPRDDNEVINFCNFGVPKYGQTE